jgi:hypothetical protein
MAQFLVVLYDNVADMEYWAQLGPEEIGRIIGEYGSWSEGLAAAIDVLAPAGAEGPGGG